MMNAIPKILPLLLIGSAGAAHGQEHLKSLDARGIDKEIPASVDFYQHVNKGWMESHPLTPEYSRYGQFNILTDSSNNRVRKIVTNLAKTNPAKGSTPFKVASLYESGMDSLKRNALGANPIKPGIDRIEKTEPADMKKLLVWLHQNYTTPLFDASPMENLVNSKEYAMYAGGAGLTLGDRDYYLKNDKRNKEVREAYRTLIERQMQNAGFKKKDARRIAANTLKVETLLADSTWTREESRNIRAMYNPMTLDSIKLRYSNIPWEEVFTVALGIQPPTDVIVTNPNTLQQADNLLRDLSDREKKDYYLSQFVLAASPYLSDDFTNADFEFSKVMSGVQKQQPRWKKSLATTEGVLGEAIGELYVKEYFPQSSKDYMIGLVENLRTALGKHIINLPWMSDDTKLKAISKLNSITVKIGYPDKWKDYSDLEIDPSLSYWENVHNAKMWGKEQYMKKWGKPVDRTEWGMTPQTINAYYNPMNNEIVFPAGILQTPFFDAESSDAENYGGIGVVIGHEMTHGFDDQGCQFDANGNMANWWTEEDAKAFSDLSQGLVGQFNEVDVLPDLKANGQYTLGENIADQGGLRVAMTAFLDAQKKKGIDVNSKDAEIDGLNPIQVFYMNYANLWANNIREEEMRTRTISDVHSLGKNRVNVTLKNLEPFFSAFGIKKGDAMFRPENERIIIW